MNKTKVLVLGSGLVSRPGIHYLLGLEELFVTVASNELEVAQKLIQGFSKGEAVFIDVEDKKSLMAMVQNHDIIISLLPSNYHDEVAAICLHYSKDMVTASYASEKMKTLDKEASERGLLFLNEIGVDPGIDHMSAMKIIDEISWEGGRVLHFYSFCGGLPAPDSNNNPFGYKFSWSPKGVVLASKSPARYLENGRVIDIEGKNLFLNYRMEEVEGLGRFEVYPNRDSLPYKELYGLKDARTVMRGTFRYPGWCETFKKIVDLGLLDDKPRSGLTGMTYKELMSDLVGLSSEEDIIKRIAEKIWIAEDSEIFKRLKWLGLFGDDQIPPLDNMLDILCYRLQEKLFYKEDERDMILMRHKFVTEGIDTSKETITSTLIDFGIPGGDSSMARTVSLPLAIGVKLMAEGKIKLKGVQIPRQKEIYKPILEELEQLNIKMIENRVSY
jgi:saccharopine dehydrogenase-like NADP-dependent oxidoreductase